MFITLGGLVLLIFIGFWFLSKPKHIPPGPIGIPFFGYLPWLVYYANNRIKLFQKLKEKYGKIVCLRVGFNYMIILNELEVIKDGLTNKGDQFSGRGLKMIQQEITGGKGIIFNEGKYQRENRRFILRSLRNMGFGKMTFEKPIIETIKNLCNKIDEHISNHPNKVMNLRFTLVEAVADNITQILLGVKFDSDQLNFMIERLKAFETIPVTFFLLNSFPFLLPLLKFKIFRKFFGIEQFKNLRKPLEEMIFSYVKEHKESFNENNINDFLYSYIEEQSNHQDTKEDSYWWDDQQIKHACTELIAAGIATTEATNSWSLLLMANNQPWQKKVQKEIFNVIGSERTPSTRDIQNLPLCEASILEILRWSILAPTGIPLAMTEDCQFEGYFIPKDSAVFANLYAVSRDKRVWLDPNNFNPEDNFLSADRTHVINRDKIIPFGIGRRSCIGESLAKMEITLFFLRIFQKYTVSLDPKDSMAEPSPKLFRVPSHRNIIFHPKNL